MKYNKSLTLALLAAGLMTTLSSGAQAQNSELRASALQKRSAAAVQLSQKTDTAIVQLRMDELKDSSRIKEQELSRSLAPQIQRAAERQGVKASQSDITNASDKLASILSNSDIIDLEDAVPGISIKVNIKFGKPMEIGIEIKF